jgi:hypothetical protein
MKTRIRSKQNGPKERKRTMKARTRSKIGRSRRKERKYEN